MDWFVVLTPLLLVLLLPLVFVGCGLEAVGHKGTVTFLGFGHAIADANKPNVVSNSPILMLTVYWLVRDWDSNINQVSSESRGSVGGPPLVWQFGENAFKFDLPLPMAQSIGCRCGVLLGGGEGEMTTGTVWLPYKGGQQHNFTLTRTVNTHQVPGYSPPAFYVMPETVGN